jgi:hypothetical protein
VKNENLFEDFTERRFHRENISKERNPDIMCNRNVGKKLYVSGVKYKGMLKSQQNAREERYIYVSSGPQDGTALITTFKKKRGLL